MRGLAETSAGDRAGVRRRLLLTVEETAIMLGVGRTTLFRAVRHGRVPFPVYRIGGCTYVPRVAVERLLAGELPSAPRSVPVPGAPAAGASGGGP